MPDRTIRVRGAVTTPLIVIDDIPLSYTVSVERWKENPPLDQLSVEDIERIDVMQGPRAAFSFPVLSRQQERSVCLTIEGISADGKIVFLRKFLLLCAYHK